jgi:hypothetical protein
MPEISSKLLRSFLDRLILLSVVIYIYHISSVSCAREIHGFRWRPAPCDPTTMKEKEKEIGETISKRFHRKQPRTHRTHRRGKSLTGRVYWPCSSRSWLVLDLCPAPIPITAIGRPTRADRRAQQGGGPSCPIRKLERA